MRFIAPSWRGVLIAIGVLFTFLRGPVIAQDAPASGELWFSVGERLRYDMRWGIFPVGTTTVESEWQDGDSNSILRIRYLTRTNPFCDRLYRVNDLIEAWIEPQSFLPLRFHKKLEEGDYRCDEITTFDRERGVVRWESLTEGKVLEYPAPADLRDIVSLMYLLRRHAFEPGTTNVFNVAGDQGPTEIRVVVQDTVRVDTPGYGRRRSVRLRPLVSNDSLFQRKVPDQVWVSLDARRLLLQMTVDVPVGHITMGLAAVEGPGAAEWIAGKEREP